MKGNNGSGNIEERDDWETPQWLFNIIDAQYDFTFDCCANEDNTKCEDWAEEFEILPNIFFKDHLVWMNPPFSKAEEMFKYFFDVTKKGVCIYRCDNLETKIWQDIILKNATWIFFPKGRISYEGKAGKGSRFPSALIGFNVAEPNGLDGVTLYIKKDSYLEAKKSQ